MTPAAEELCHSFGPYALVKELRRTFRGKWSPWTPLLIWHISVCVLSDCLPPSTLPGSQACNGPRPSEAWRSAGVVSAASGPNGWDRKLIWNSILCVLLKLDLYPSPSNTVEFKVFFILNHITYRYLSHGIFIKHNIIKHNTFVWYICHSIITQYN